MYVCMYVCMYVYIYIYIYRYIYTCIHGLPAQELRPAGLIVCEVRASGFKGLGDENSQFRM